MGVCRVMKPTKPNKSNWRNVSNFAVGMILGVIVVPMWNYSRFLYYTVFCIEVIIIYIIINYRVGKK